MGVFNKRKTTDGFAGARNTLAITYEDVRGVVEVYTFDTPPTFVTRKHHYLTFAAGALREEGIDFERILKVSTVEVIFDQTEEGLAALKELADKEA